MALTEIESFGHEQVIFCHNAEAGLKAIIAIHDTTLGPSLGGLRMRPYASDAEALRDVLRLSRGMTLKAAAAGLNLGGGKAVIIGDPKRDKSEVLFRAFGRAVESLGGRYVTAEDMGTDVNDMEYIFMETAAVTGIDTSHGGSGDPSPFTALGVLQGMRAAAEVIYDGAGLEGKRVAVQGLGHVGENLVRLLLDEGASVVACDIDEERVEAVRAELPQVEIVGLDAIYDADVDIFAPCAMGSPVNDETIERIKAKIICGAANNQLDRDELGAELMRRGVLYAPDYVVNAGGLINVSLELEGYSRERALRLTRGIYYNTMKLLRIARAEGIPTNEAADRMARQRIDSLGRVHNSFSRFRHKRMSSGRRFSRS
jgi:leucine dehydrogenase